MLRLRRHIESTSCNEFKRRFLYFLATSHATIGSVSHKNSRRRWRRQCSATKIKGELRAIFRLCWTAVTTNWCKKMRINNTALKLARFIHIMLRKCALSSWLFPEYFVIFAVDWSYWALQKNFTSISQEKLTGYYQEFKGKWTN